jgi:hypothetical protein
MSETPLAPDFLEARKTLFKLMNGVGDRFEMLWDNKSDLLAIWNRSMETSEALKDMKSRDALDVLPPKAKALSKLFAYLGLVESLGVTLMDMALTLLIVNGREMHVRKEGGIMHVSTLKDLHKLDLIYKLGFLKANKLQFVAGVVNRQLRNDIAHLKFRIEENGEVKGSDGNLVNVDNTLTEFWSRVEQIISIFEHIRFLHFIQQRGNTTDWQNVPQPTESHDS